MTQRPSTSSDDGTKPTPPAISESNLLKDSTAASTRVDDGTDLTPRPKSEPSLLKDGTAAIGELWSFLVIHWRALGIAVSLAAFPFGMWKAGEKVRTELIRSNEALSPRFDRLSAELHDLQLTSETHKAALDDQDSQLIELLRRVACDDLEGGSESACKESLRKFHKIYVAQHDEGDHQTCSQKSSPCLQESLKLELNAAKFTVSSDTEFKFSNAHLGKKAGLGLIVKGSMNMGDACALFAAARRVAARRVPPLNLAYLALSRGIHARQTIIGMSATALKTFPRIRMTSGDWEDFCDLAPEDMPGVDGNTNFDGAFKAFSENHPERFLAPALVDPTL